MFNGTDVVYWVCTVNVYLNSVLLVFVHFFCKMALVELRDSSLRLSLVSCIQCSISVSLLVVHSAIYVHL